jgi:coenzyme PQQ precursor peptide PqqA
VRSFIGGLDVSSGARFWRTARTHENLEVSFMIIPFAAEVPGYRMGRGGRQLTARFIDLKDIFMKWETPQAVDFRFGMEITMYIANR